MYGQASIPGSGRASADPGPASPSPPAISPAHEVASSATPMKATPAVIAPQVVQVAYLAAAASRRSNIQGHHAPARTAMARPGRARSHADLEAVAALLAEATRLAVDAAL